jgi:hypothetical protein
MAHLDALHCRDDSSLNWHQAGTSERKAAFGLLAVATFALVLVLAVTMT